MKFLPTPLQDLYVIEIEPISDSRGFFARSFCLDELEKQGLKFTIVQSNISFNKKAGTFRGMHYQKSPFEEIRLVRCTKGTIYDVVVDLRPESKTYKQYFAQELSEENHKMMYVPKGFAHGFLTLKDNTEIFYEMSEVYHSEATAGIRFDDPAIGIKWPIPIAVISDKDNEYPFIKE